MVGGVASDTRQTIEKGKSFYTTITTTQSTLSFTSASVTMGGLNVSSNYLTITKSKVTINIPSVTGDIHIDARTEDIGSGGTPPKYPCTGLSVGGSITVKEGANSIAENKPGTIGYMYPTYTPINCTDSPSGSSSNSSVAEAMCTNFINGTITVRVVGYKAGSCTITIRMGNYSGSFGVIVTK